MGARPIITLTTDFGLRDAYVATMKGVILGICPEAQLTDVSHEVAAQQVAEAAYLLEHACPYFPEDAVHLAVVDPGVGTDRRAIAIDAGGSSLVGPDNGIFVPLLTRQGLIDHTTGELRGTRAFELRDERFRRLEVSSTFHGRDIFAPAAAHLASGLAISELGPEIDVLHVLEHRPVIHESGRAIGEVVHIDRFGNAVTNIPGDVIGKSPTVRVAGRSIPGLAVSYRERELSGLIGSGGYLEIAARDASAADALGLAVGEMVVVDFTS